MKKKSSTFKFDLEERVFIMGLQGMCIVNGRGPMNFVSGGTINMYQLGGSHSTIRQECELMSVEEWKATERSF